LREDKLAGDLGNVIEATSIRGSSVGFFCSRKISTRQFETFTTISALVRRPRCPLSGPLSGANQKTIAHFETYRF
jgi:hypothetical protein